MLSRGELLYLARENKPVWGGHLKRGEPLNDDGLKRALADGIIKQIGLEGYVITVKGRKMLGDRCPECGRAY